MIAKGVHFESVWLFLAEAGKLSSKLATQIVTNPAMK